MKKIGFCFLIYDTITHEEIWNIFFSNIDTTKYSIYIHYKNNMPLVYFEKYKLKNCLETKYADVSLIHAYNMLFKTAFDDGCDKMILVSQSCIPFKSFNYIYDFLTKDSLCHFNITPHSQCFPRCTTLLKYYDRAHIQKSSNWFILNRKACELVISSTVERINEEYTSIYAPEEHYYIMKLFVNNLQGELCTTPNLANQATTFTNWEGMDYKYVSTNGLKNYSSISEEELVYLLESPCLFGRKFSRECCLSLFNDKYLTSISST